ncbi:MAG: LamG domain-containing protein [Verrucomicrobia bacterium]|nr:LamG domain-containing protein [Verrucomicrobiota bacterium]
MESLISFWDFQSCERGGYRAHGPGDYLLRPRPEYPPHLTEGVFGDTCIRLSPGRWLECPRLQCPLLNIHGQHCEVSVVAWIRWQKVSHCQFIAGMWDETMRARQYGLFLNLNRRYNSDQNVHAHVSSDGGPTHNGAVCLSYATGSTRIETGRWYMLAMTYDGKAARVYVDGQLDVNNTVDPVLGQLNPLSFDRGLYNGGSMGADFTVGSVFTGSRMNNWFQGDIGGVAVFSRALDSAQLLALPKQLKTLKQVSLTVG